MDLDNTTQSEPLTSSPKWSKETIASDFLKTSRLLHNLAITLLPLLGLVIALIVAIWTTPIGPIEMGLLVGMWILSGTAITVGFHRHFTHRTFKTTTPIRVILAILGSMALQGPLIYWVALHRRHHEYSDQPGDPHSPHLHTNASLEWLRGLWHAHIGWMFNHEIPNPIHYAPDLLRDEAISKVNRLYFLWVFLGLAIPATLGGVLSISWMGAFYGFLWGGPVRILVAENFIWSINSITHVYGRRPFNTYEYSTNNIWLAIPTFGESWHNNHHAFPNSAIFGLKWWQIDWGAGSSLR